MLRTRLTISLLLALSGTSVVAEVPTPQINLSCGVAIVPKTILRNTALELIPYHQVAGVPSKDGVAPGQGTFVTSDGVEIISQFDLVRPLNPPNAITYPGGEGYVNLREAPTTAGENIIGQISGHEYVHAACQSSGWYRVRRASGQMGWVYGNFVEILHLPSSIVDLELTTSTPSSSPNLSLRPTQRPHHITNREEPRDGVLGVPFVSTRSADDGLLDARVRLKRGKAWVENAEAEILNLRAGPGLDFAVIAELRNGQDVYIEQLSLLWAKVTTANGIEGSVYAKHLNQ